MYYGNFFVGKLLEAKHVGRGTFTDVGTTYKLCRNCALAVCSRHWILREPRIQRVLPGYRFGLGFRIVECPMTFHERVG